SSQLRNHLLKNLRLKSSLRRSSQLRNHLLKNLRLKSSLRRSSQLRNHLLKNLRPTTRALTRVQQVEAPVATLLLQASPVNT
ncbi:MAG: hypothetical protein QXJ74_04870, partial [Nitrososphaera sp.]